MTDSNGTVTRSLAVNIIPKLDKDKFAQQFKDLFSGLGGAVTGDGKGGSLDELKKEIQNLAEAIKNMQSGLNQTQNKAEANTEGQNNGTTGTRTKNGSQGKEEKGTKRKGGSKGTGDKTSLKEKLGSDTFKAIYRTIGTFTRTAISGLKRGFGILQNLYNRVKQSSQFLAAVENMFNLAMTLLLLPFGNALATTILPAMIDLVDGVLGLWDEMDEVFDGTSGTLSKILDVILDKGLDKFGEFFNSLGDKLDDNSGILGAIGTAMHTIGKFIQNGLEPTLTLIFNIMSKVLEHFKEFVVLYVSYQSAMLGAQMFSSIPGVGSIIGGMLGGGIGAGVTDSYISKYASAEGGYVPATAGGSLRVIGEAGEGEYIIPESKLRSQSSGTIINNFYGYTETELKQIVRDTLREEVQNSSYTGII